LGWAKRGQNINDEYGDPSFPPNFPGIDRIPDGAATSIKSIDLNAKTYQKEASLTYRLNQDIADVQDFEGANWGGKEVKKNDITGRTLELIVPKGSMTDAQREVIDRVRARAMKDPYKPVDIITREH
jgi:hypothetical protein